MSDRTVVLRLLTELLGLGLGGGPSRVASGGVGCLRHVDFSGGGWSKTYEALLVSISRCQTYQVEGEGGA